MGQRRLPKLRASGLQTKTNARGSSVTSAPPRADRLASTVLARSPSSWQRFGRFLRILAAFGSAECHLPPSWAEVPASAARGEEEEGPTYRADSGAVNVLGGWEGASWEVLEHPAPREGWLSGLHLSTLFYRVASIFSGVVSRRGPA